MSAFLPKMSAAEFNAKFPVGSEFDYYSVRGGPEVCEPFRTKTRSEAWTLGNGAVIVSCEGKSGGLSTMHLKPVQRAGTKAAPDLLDVLRDVAICLRAGGDAQYREEVAQMVDRAATCLRSSDRVFQELGYARNESTGWLESAELYRALVRAAGGKIS